MAFSLVASSRCKNQVCIADLPCVFLSVCCFLLCVCVCVCLLSCLGLQSCSNRLCVCVCVWGGAACVCELPARHMCVCVLVGSLYGCDRGSVCAPCGSCSYFMLEQAHWFISWLLRRTCRNCCQTPLRQLRRQRCTGGSSCHEEGGPC